MGQPAIRVTLGQAAPAIRGPVAALRLDGDRLLIGQGTSLTETRVTADTLEVIRSSDLHRHDLRAITTSQGITFVLSEDGLTTLDAAGKVADFAQGGGQSLAVKNGRVYIGALHAGIRVYRVNAAGKLTRLGVIPTVGSALDVAPESDTWLWVAEGDAGLRLYDTSTQLEAASAMLWIANLSPASVIRISGTRVYIGYGNQLSVLDTLDIRAPRLLGTFTLAGSTAQVGDLIVQGSRAFVGRVDTAGADVIALDISNPKAITPIAQFGENGTGERFVLHGEDLFVGSGRLGLRRVRFGNGAPAVVTAWEPLAPAAPCVADIPGNPQPPNLGEVPRGPVTVTWTSSCNSGNYAVQIDKTPVPTLETTSSSYTFTPRHGITTWQVTSIDRLGSRTAGPTWTFETLIDGWLAGPASPPRPDLLYTPAPQIKLQSPGAVLAATCAALIAGLMLVVIIAWLIGQLSQRRTTDHYGNLR